MFHKATFRMWRDRLGRAQSFTENFSIANRMKVTLNPVTWIVFMLMCVGDIVALPFTLLFFCAGKFLNARTLDTLFLNLIVMMILLASMLFGTIHAVGYAKEQGWVTIVRDEPRDATITAPSPSKEKADKLLQDRRTLLDTSVVYKRKRESGALASVEDLTATYKVFDEVGSGCMRNMVNDLIGRGFNMTNDRIGTIITRCAENYGTKNDPDYQRRQLDAIKNL